MWSIRNSELFQVFVTMAFVFFSLPPELQSLTLHYVGPLDLDRLFGLDSLLHFRSHDPYLIVRHQALAAKYHASRLVMSNDPETLTFSLAQLDYLIRHNIVVAPRDITFEIVDFTNYASSVVFMRTLFHTYLAELARYTRNFSIRLMLVESVPLENSLLRALFEPLCSPQFNVQWFTIKYLPAFGKTIPRGTMEVNLADWLHSGNEISMENLKLHLFDSTNLLKHLVRTDGCFHCENLRTLDLSYNNLADWHLRDLKFPSRLESLNLSNNQLRILSNSNFHHQQLTNLKSLDLSNNNLMKLQLHDYRTGPNGPYVLESVNLSGNIILDYSCMFECLFFGSIQNVDLSLNLIEKVTKFPPSVTSIDLSGNYISLSSETVNDMFPKGLRKLSVGFSAPFNHYSEELLQLMVKNAGLSELQELQCCGRTRGWPLELY